MIYLYVMENNVIKYTILEQLITENRVNQAKEAYPCIPPPIIDYFSQNDPSGNNKYLNWMCKQFWDDSESINGGYVGEYQTVWTWLRDVLDDRYDEDGSDNGEINNATIQPTCAELWNENTTTRFNGNISGWEEGMADMIINEVKNFHRFSAALREKDINKYNYDSLIRALEPAILKSQEKDLAKDVTKIYEDNDWLMLSPKTHNASCAYGANTKWCVTMRNDPAYYQRYTRDDFYLIFVIKKKDNKKWAINTKQKLEQPTEDVVLNLPWHREVDLSGSRTGNAPVKKVFPESGHNKNVERMYKNVLENKYETTYWDAEDNSIGWDRFVEQSGLPKNLQQLLRAIEKKIIINFTRKKKGDVAYETNLNPVRLKKGDKVKLLASGRGYFRGDEGIIMSTIEGAPGKLSVLDPTHFLGRYFVHVPNRESLYGRTIPIRNSDGTRTNVPVVSINGQFLQKITPPRKKKA